jgi:hypothetical protein
VDGVRVDLYPTYGFQQGDDWLIPLRGWVHQRRRLPDDLLARIATEVIGCPDGDRENLKSRLDGFTDDSRSRQEVAFVFADDPSRQEYRFPKSDLNGLIEMDLVLPKAKVQEILNDPAPAGNWLTINVVSSGHAGQGRIRLIGRHGLSVVSDIDDTIKVTGVPAGKDVVLSGFAGFVCRA